MNTDKPVVVACGTMRPELTVLADAGSVDKNKLFFTAPGLHERMPILEKQLKTRLESIEENSKGIIVIYGRLCYVDMSNPYRAVDALCEEVDTRIERIQAENCVDMIADLKTREQIASGSRVYWLTPGWIRYWNSVFYEWDKGKYNETFGRFDKAVLLDTEGIYDKLCFEEPEKILSISDLMGIPLEAKPTDLERLKTLVKEAEARLEKAN